MSARLAGVSVEMRKPIGAIYDAGPSTMDGVIYDVVGNSQELIVGSSVTGSVQWSLQWPVAASKLSCLFVGLWADWLVAWFGCLAIGWFLAILRRSIVSILILQPGLLRRTSPVYVCCS